MLEAVCRIENTESKTYSVFKFQSFSDVEIERLRQHLFCPVCHGKAYFRKASKDGKAACFGSRYHQADCGEFKPSAVRQQEESDAVEVNQMLVDSQALVIDFSKKLRRNSTCYDKPHPLINDTKLTQVNSLKGRYQVESSEKRIATEGLEKLLNSLLRGSDLAGSDLWVYTDDKYRWRAKNLFVNFKDAEPTENGAPRMYWGTISHADKAMQWLNPADCNDVGIPIDGLQDAIKQRFIINTRRDFEGAGVIIFGKCFWNKDKTRKIVQLWNRDLHRIHIAIAADDE